MSANWNGKTPAGVPFPNGEFTWTLKATALATSTATTVTSGDGFLQRGSAVHAMQVRFVASRFTG